MEELTKAAQAPVVIIEQRHIAPTIPDLQFSTSHLFHLQLDLFMLSCAVKKSCFLHLHPAQHYSATTVILNYCSCINATESSSRNLCNSKQLNTIYVACQRGSTSLDLLVYPHDDKVSPPHNVNKGLAKCSRVRMKREGGCRSWPRQTCSHIVNLK